MKKVISITIFLLVGLVIMAFSSDQVFVSPNEKLITPGELAGLWRDSNNTTYKNSSIIFSVEGANIEMLHYMEWKGQPFVEKGRGKIYGRKLDYFVVVTKSIVGWALTGEHFLTLSADGRTLRGAYEDELGNMGALVFKKVGK
tara:strand:- start:71 stop:499 length:429 start_codon:yes stop_codon:yes gene_type:complete